jgi:hypothetical protein
MDMPVWSSRISKLYYRSMLLICDMLWSASTGKLRRAAASTLRLRLQIFLVDGRTASSLVHAYLCLLIRFIMGLAEATT